MALFRDGRRETEMQIVSGHERRIFHRFNHTLDFSTQVNEQAVAGRTMNTSSGGALLALETPPAFGDRLHLNMTPKEEVALVTAVVDVVHCGQPGEDGLHRIGVRWVELYSPHGEEGIREFLVKILGMVHSRIRHVKNPEERFVFEFPSFFFQTPSSGSALADVLEPTLPGARSMGDEPRANGPLSKSPSSRKKEPRGHHARGGGDEFDALWDDIEPVLRGLSARSRSTRARNELKDPETLARMTQASTRKVPTMRVLVKVRGKKHKGTLCRIGLMSMDLIGEDVIPRAYDRVDAIIKIPNGPSSAVDVTLSGTVSRVKDDGTYTIRFTRVEERGNEGLFEAFVLTLLERDPQD